MELFLQKIDVEATHPAAHEMMLQTKKYLEGARKRSQPLVAGRGCLSRFVSLVSLSLAM
ncbi:MAG: hypothetical protein ACJAQT_004450 [Akkermansiaceae bacterium]|jgi:hypothetical protein